MYDAVLRSQDLFPWKQGAGGEMATPPQWEKKLVLSLVSQVSAWMAFQNICSPTLRLVNDTERYDTTFMM